MDEDTVIAVVNDWTDFLVDATSPLRTRLSAFFLGKQPEAMLPHPIATIETAVKAYVAWLESSGKTEQADQFGNSLMFLSEYTDNKSALVEALKDIELRNRMVEIRRNK